MELSTPNMRRWFLIIFAISCLLLNAVAFVLYQKNEQIADSQNRVVHTYAVLNTTSSVFTKIQDMETAQRGFQLTGDEDFLGPYNLSARGVVEDIAHLRELTVDNPARQRDIADLEAVFLKKKALIEKKIANRRAGQPPSRADMELSKAHMDDIRMIHARIIDDEQHLLQKRQDQSRKTQQNYVTTIFISSGLSLLGLLIANGMIVFLGLRRQVAEENLLRINREMEGFTYIASHDLRSPLVNLRGFASEMRLGLTEVKPIIEKAASALSDEDRKKLHEVMESDIPDALHYIHSSVEKMDKLTNAILELSRIGRREMTVEPVNVQRIARHCLDTLQHQISTRGIDVKLHNLPVVMADSLSVEQVMGNIIDNAIKYLDPARPGKIEIGGRRSYRETTYWVRDNGRGISQHDVQKIFEIYRRGGGVSDVQGEGMGMAYVRATLRRMGGTIWCESEPGVGTTFFFTISNALKKDEKL